MSERVQPSRRRALRRRSAAHQFGAHFGPNMTPMVDVVMVILVFFMASAAFLGPEWYLKSLVPQKPAEGAGEAGQAGPKKLELPPVRLEITLRRDAAGRTLASMAGRTDLSIESMLEALRVFADGMPKAQIEVLLRPESNVPYRDVVRLHEGAARAGIGRVGIGLSDAAGATPGPTSSGRTR
jgi:biopolymer transport protein ExbD